MAPLELLFDLIFVFAFTQVIHLASDARPSSLLEAAAVFGVLWWTWALFAWLANELDVGSGVGRIGLLGAVAIVFIIALAIPDAFRNGTTGFPGSLVFAIGFIAVSLLYTAAELVGTRGERLLQRQVLITMGVTLVPVSAALLTGATLGGEWQIATWLAAVVYQAAAVLLTSLRGQWRLGSPRHYAERHELVVILALGESIISAGAGIAGRPISVGFLASATASITLTVAMWWAYFWRLAPSVEHHLARRTGLHRALLGAGGTYAHLLIVAGILLVATGLEHSIGNSDVTTKADHFGGPALMAGLAAFLVGTAMYWSLLSGRPTWPRLVAAGLAAGVAPVLAVLPALIAPIAGTCLLALAVSAERAPRVAAPQHTASA